MELKWLCRAHLCLSWTSCPRPAHDAHATLTPPPPPLLASQTGTTLSRSSRKKHAPQRPADGWGLLVQPLGKAARAAAAEPFVALPDGSRRELSADEKLQLERQQPRPHHKIL